MLEVDTYDDEAMEDRVLAKITAENILAVLWTLPEKQSQVVIKNVLQQKNLTEIAAELNIKVQAVNNFKNAL